jgi:hypothetical protein
MAESSTDRPGRAGRPSLIWLQGLGCGALLTFAAPMALLLGVLMAPSLATLVAEQEGERGTTRAVAFAGGAASLTPAWRLWSSGDSMEAAWASLLDPWVLGLAWGAGATAWALCQILAVLLRVVWDVREAARARAIEAELKASAAEWDLDGI